MDAYFDWCRVERERVLDESPMAKALGYSLNQEAALRRFLEDGRLPLHNNLSELQLRREAVGRKNWLFVGSENGAEANATFVSLIASCGLHELEPWAYLRDLFCLLPSWPRRRVLELAPAYFKHTLEQTEAQAQGLARNGRGLLARNGHHAAPCHRAAIMENGQYCANHGLTFATGIRENSSSPNDATLADIRSVARAMAAQSRLCCMEVPALWSGEGMSTACLCEPVGQYIGEQ